MFEFYPRQVAAIQQLAPRLMAHGACIDASDTGTGKTITALGVAQALGRTPLVVCPKSILTQWERAARLVGVGFEGIVNVEKLRTGRQKWVSKGSRKSDWFWKLPEKPLIIWDEVQNSGGNRTLNAYLLANLKFKAPVLLSLIHI